MSNHLEGPVTIGDAGVPTHPNPGGGYKGDPDYDGVMPLKLDLILPAEGCIGFVDKDGYVRAAICCSDPYGVQIYGDVHPKGSIFSLNGQIHWHASRTDFPERRNWGMIQDADGEAGGLSLCVSAGSGLDFTRIPVMTWTRNKEARLHGTLTVERLAIKDVAPFSGTIPPGAKLIVKDGLITGYEA